MRARFVIGIVFLLIQVGLIVYAQFIPQRFFCWAPYDQHTRFEVFVTINGELLSNEESVIRYRHHMKGWEQRSIDNIFSFIEQYEATYGKEENTHVEIVYSTNGKPDQKWTLKR